MHKRLVFFGISFFLIAAVLSCFAENIQLHVMSFNIRYGTANDGENRWQHRKELVCKVLKNHDADVVGLQEALKFQIDAIIARTPAYAMIGVGRDDGDTLGEYSAILYKKDRFIVKESGTFWFSDTPDIVASKSWGNTITRICTWALFEEKSTGKAFYIYNLHLDHRSQPSREKSVELLAKKISERTVKSPFIITGDFNAGEENPAVRFLTSGSAPKYQALPLVDTFRALHPDAKEVGTFNGFEGRTTGDKIDYIFVPKGTKVLKASIIRDNSDGRYPSDHFPVQTVITF